jgi:hypothetical protein
VWTNGSIDVLSEGDSTFESAKQEFRRAWDEPRHTRFRFPPVNVNRVLNDRYRMVPEVQITGSMLWDLQYKKAQDPVAYMRHLVLQARCWGWSLAKDHSERFFISTLQHGLVVPRQGLVMNDVFVSHAERRIIFLGRSRLHAQNGIELMASTFQPLFHVDRGVGGADDEPVSLSSIVLLDKDMSGRYFASLAEKVCAGYLPKFIETYIERDLCVELTRK